MTLEQFCKKANLETFDCGEGWGGRVGIKVKGSNFSLCGFRTVKAAQKAYIKENCGDFGNAVLKLLKA